jgi:hypothetical protein
VCTQRDGLGRRPHFPPSFKLTARTNHTNHNNPISTPMIQQCCNHPYLFTGVEDRTLDPLGDHVVTNCGKMFLLDKVRREGRKI